MAVVVVREVGRKRVRHRTGWLSMQGTIMQRKRGGGSSTCMRLGVGNNVMMLACVVVRAI